MPNSSALDDVPRPASLESAFLDDHKHLTQGFASLMKSLRERDFVSASRLAERLDRLAGAHIQFEEECLYPIVARIEGPDYASNLYHEHRVGLSAIRTLKRLPEELEDDAVEDLLSDVQTALDHAVSCGTLLSHLTTLSGKEQGELLDRLVELRRQPPLWTEIEGR